MSSYKSLRVLAFKIYFFALYAALRAMLSGRLIAGLKFLIAPVGYWRFLPNAYVYREFLRRGSRRVLDVSSPKLMSLLLSGSAHVVATDLEDAAIFVRWKGLADALGRMSYTVQYEDARKLSFPDQSFDLVYSISVIEHIPDNGDTAALREMQRVLKPGGCLVIEVPYRRQHAEIYQNYDSKGARVERTQFYERHYDAKSIEERLQAPGMKVVEKLILGEWLPIDPWIAVPRLPRLLRLLVLPFEPWLAAINYRAGTADRSGRPLAALVIYERGTS